jgi:hypothetical protein
MYITSISLCYALLGVTVIACGFFVYFKTLVIKTENTKEGKDKILGKMKDPVAWRNKNNRMSYVSLFWTVVSLLLFIYLKFFLAASLVSILYIFAYIALIVITAAFAGMKNKASI